MRIHWLLFRRWFFNWSDLMTGYNLFILYCFVLLRKIIDLVYCLIWPMPKACVLCFIIWLVLYSSGVYCIFVWIDWILRIN
jgi:hypothetical protein